MFDCLVHISKSVVLRIHLLRPSESATRRLVAGLIAASSLLHLTKSSGIVVTVSLFRRNDLRVHFSSRSDRHSSSYPLAEERWQWCKTLRLKR